MSDFSLFLIFGALVYIGSQIGKLAKSILIFKAASPREIRSAIEKMSDEE